MNLGRRSLLKIGAGVGAGLAVGELVDIRKVHAATKGLKLAGAKEFTTACNFCSCGCGMVCSVRDGKLLQLEGDPDHAVNAGALCSKGAAMKATHDSPQRVRKPMYRAPGSDKWEEISWDAALGKVAAKVKEVRDATWVRTENVGGTEHPVNRTDGIAFLGGAQNTNEECYLFKKAFSVLGTAYIEHQARL